MNRAEYIIKTVDDADTRGDIAPRDKAQVLMEVATLLNSGLPPDEIDLSEPMEKLWKRVGRKWGKT